MKDIVLAFLNEYISTNGEIAKFIEKKDFRKDGYFKFYI